MSLIVTAIVDGILKYAFSYLTQIMEKRGLIQQGREAQHSADLQASVHQGEENAKTQEAVQAMDDSAVDAELERMRHRPSSPGHE